MHTVNTHKNLRGSKHEDNSETFTDRQKLDLVNVESNSPQAADYYSKPQERFDFDHDGEKKVYFHAIMPLAFFSSDI